MNKILSCFDVTNYFLSKSGTLSNLKLQKLAYYSQSYSLFTRNKPIFKEKILCWKYGPVVKELYDKYKEYGAGYIPKIKEINLEIYNEEDKIILEKIFALYGIKSAWDLSEMSHKEFPWLNTIINDEISHEDLKEAFKNNHVDALLSIKQSVIDNIAVFDRLKDT